ncbi:MAG: Cof-type HAD-IIB family hydrolase [Clostridiales bacterium]|nr:Cof-type HAD-IIB family hydrolase [Clostridiales bacterium]
MKRKLVVFDADGTIIDYNVGGVVVESTKKAIEQLKKAGHIPAIITGRSYNMIDRLALELGIEYLGVLNGAQIFKGNELIYSRSLGEETSHKLLDGVEKTNLSMIAFDAKLVYYRNISDKWKEFINASINMESNMVPIDDRAYDFASFYTYGDADILEKAVEGITGIEFHNNRHEITKIGVDKGRALCSLAEIFDINIEDTIAFGDGINDVSMLRAAGTGIAIKSGNPLVLEAADVVADEGPDAIYKYLKSLGLI